ncbi:N-acetylmuramoyl-L-alanine amidase AmiA [Polaribacter huanghezhanensis]|uniref:N-acetylmuramoyl-L-alanine amidase family protein n=1 Tax=Polaribacter huanghezhanensis TaxID=1354726 RepID=UPI002648947D|nr:N-acetylmuramoyl-L-alanine amidase [Polaribacter huanghezhanensis]WKD84721.1 N-acetylmuramoyl-L-alanine amidase AmiA [Polaribacter huanghezhanensis]
MPIVEHLKYNHKTKLFTLFICSLFFLSASEFSFAQKKTYTIVLDAGHGGHDPGNIGNGYREKNIALKVALEVGKIIGKEKDIKVVFTRKKDVFIELWKRGSVANRIKADLFVSIHCDSHTTNAYGIGTFVLGARGNRQNLEIAKRENSVILLEKDYKQNYNYDPNSPESVIGLSLLQEENLDRSLQLASLIQNNLVTKLNRHNRYVKMDNFQVLRETIMPSVLVELGFLTNKKEGRFLNSRSGQQAMAKNIASSIVSFVNQLKINTVDVVSVDKYPVVVEPKDVVQTTQVEYKIQIASSRKKIATKAYNFKGLKDVESIKVGRFYKYYYGKTTNYKNIQSLLKRVKKKGYRSAFIAAFKDGEKISVKQALKTR